MRSLYIACLAVSLPILASAYDDQWIQARLERILCHGCEPADNFPNGDPPDVPLRDRDALAEFNQFISGSGWTTNQFIEGLVLAFTNCTTVTNWTDKERLDIAGAAVWKLSEINHPAITNLFKRCNDDVNFPYKEATIPGMLPYTNLEPEVMSYMRTLCVQTNIYDDVATIVMTDMFEALSTMPDALKPAATNRVAQYMYFAIHHVTDSQGWQDIELSRFIPAYSNSIQRLRLMQYVANSDTNAWERSNAASVVQALSAIPTNQLNDVSWITE